VYRLIKKAGLPVEIPKALKGEHLLRRVETDKKVAGGKVKFVCIEELGKTRFDYLSVKEIGGYL
jgi:3-dehydroquinate synthetase